MDIKRKDSKSSNMDTLNERLEKVDNRIASFERLQENFEKMGPTTLAILKKSIGFGILGATIGGTFGFIRGSPMRMYILSASTSSFVSATAYWSCRDVIHYVHKKDDLLTDALAGTLSGATVFGMWGGRRLAFIGAAAFTVLGGSGHYLHQAFLQWKEKEKKKRYLLLHPEDRHLVENKVESKSSQLNIPGRIIGYEKIPNWLPYHRISDEEIEERINRKMEQLQREQNQ